jgi:hypothetical protein
LFLEPSEQHLRANEKVTAIEANSRILRDFLLPVNTGDKAARPSASSSEVVDKRAYLSGICAVSVTESHTPVGFELKIEFAVADPAQPVVFDRFARRRSSHRSNDPAITQIIQFLVACRIEAFAQHLLAPGSANFCPTVL